jgi:hypothetical protein
MTCVCHFHNKDQTLRTTTRTRPLINTRRGLRHCPFPTKTGGSSWGELHLQTQSQKHQLATTVAPEPQNCSPQRQELQSLAQSQTHKLAMTVAPEHQNSTKPPMPLTMSGPTMHTLWLHPAWVGTFATPLTCLLFPSQLLRTCVYPWGSARLSSGASRHEGP